MVHNTGLAYGELLDVEADRLPHLLQKLLHVRPGGVSVAGGFVLPGLDDDVVLTVNDFFAKIAGNTCGVFLKQKHDKHCHLGLKQIVKF